MKMRSLPTFLDKHRTVKIIHLELSVVPDILLLNRYEPVQLDHRQFNQE